MPPVPTRQAVHRLMTTFSSSSSACPCHSHSGHHTTLGATANLLRYGRNYANVKDDKEYAFEMAASNIRFGEGVTREVGLDCVNLKAKKVAVFTDPNISKLHPVRATLESLEFNKVPYVLYDKVRVEPTDISFKHAIEFAKHEQPDVFLAVGGGSVIDTTKAANLYSCYPEADFLDFVNAPIGKGRVVDKPLKTLIAIPTTAGTGSETTGTSIFDYEPLQTKTGIAHRALKPTLGIVDPLNTRSMPSAVRAASGLDVLCHALESYTAIPYAERTPRPKNPLERPAYQGSNPISDVWSMHALRMTVEYLPRAVKNPDDIEAQSAMLLAATFAGIGFGNAGVHLCHGMSYPISGLNHKYTHPGYMVDHPIVPHGVSVAVTAPAVFRFTGQACPDRHLEAALLFNPSLPSTTPLESAGEHLAEGITRFLQDLNIPNGISALGYTSDDISALVKGTLPQHRVTKLAPNKGGVGEEDLMKIFEDTLVNY